MQIQESLIAIWPLLALGLTLGLDNLAVVAGLGLAAEADRRRRWILGSFVFFELTMPLLGYGLGASLLAVFPASLAESTELIGLFLLAMSGLFVALAAGNPTWYSGLRGSPVYILILAALLGLDNLAAGAASAVSGSGTLAVVCALGAISAGLSAVGFFAGIRIADLLNTRENQKRRVPIFGGIYLVGLALLLGLSSS